MNFAFSIIFLFSISSTIAYADDFNCQQAVSSIYENQAQSISLKHSLTKIGVTFETNEDGYSALKKLSHKNTERYLTPQTHVSQEIETIVDSMNLIFVHNRSPRNSDSGIDGDALLSARRLGRGAQNTYNYNREFLQSDDNVFFFPRFIGKDFPISQARGFGISYGQVSYHLDENYAKQYGWISPFNMYPKEFSHFLKLRDKHPQAQQKLDALLNSGTNASPEELESIPQESLKELSLATFNASDFERLVKNNLKIVLSSLKVENPDEYQEIIETIREGNPNDIDLILRQHIFVPLKLAGKGKKREMFEFKVPGYVPKEYITIYE